MTEREANGKSPYMIKLVLLGVAVVVAAVLLWQMVGDDTPEEAPPIATEPAPAIPPADPEPAPEPEVEPPPVEETAQTPEPEPLPELADSDAVAMAAAEELGPSESVRDMLVDDNIILKSVRALIAMADNTAVHEYRPIESPSSSFVVEPLDEPPDEEVGQRYRLSPRNYERYQPYVDMLTSLDPQNVAAVYQRFYPLLEEAYAQHGVDRGSFKEVTLAAIDSLLAAPVLDEEPILIQPKVAYQYEDPQLESLPAPQKLLLRMGPENTRKIQASLRELRSAIAAREVP